MKDLKHKKKPVRKHPVLVEFATLFIKIAIIALVLVGLFTFVFGLFRINENTMVPNLAPGDLVMYYRLDKEYSVGETIVFQYKKDFFIGPKSLESSDFSRLSDIMKYSSFDNFTGYFIPSETASVFL